MGQFKWFKEVLLTSTYASYSTVSNEEGSKLIDLTPKYIGSLDSNFMLGVL